MPVNLQFVKNGLSSTNVKITVLGYSEEELNSFINESTHDNNTTLIDSNQSLPVSKNDWKKYVKVDRACFYCQQTNHVVSNCPKKAKDLAEMTCFHCHCKGHPKSKCPNRDKIYCSKCHQAGHKFWELKCPKIQSKVEQRTRQNSVISTNDKIDKFEKNSNVSTHINQNTPMSSTQINKNDKNKPTLSLQNSKTHESKTLPNTLTNWNNKNFYESEIDCPLNLNLFSNVSSRRKDKNKNNRSRSSIFDENSFDADLTDGSSTPKHFMNL